MPVDMMSNLIISAIGFILVSLLGIVSWFLVHSLSKIEGNMDKHASSIGELALSIKDLSGIIKSIEVQTITRHNATEMILKEHHQEIELIRTRSHYTWGKVCVLKYKVEEIAKSLNDCLQELNLRLIKSEFSDKNWELPSIIIKED